MQKVDQLSFDVFDPKAHPKRRDGEPERPLLSVLNLSGSISIAESDEVELVELYQDEPVLVQIVGLDGEIIAAEHASVSAVGSKRVKMGDLSVLTRQQSVKLG